MKSPQISTVIVAIVFALLAYLISSSILVTPVIIAAIAFVCAFIAPLISGSANNFSSTNPKEIDSGDVRTLYVGNLPYRANEAAVNELFSNYGIVQSVRLMKDKHTGKRRGFGFVEMSAKDIDKAINQLNDSEFQQRTLKVREAKERPEKADFNT